MLSRKYYVKFARLLGSCVSLEDFEQKLSEYFKQENPRFDPARFQKALKNDSE